MKIILIILGAVVVLSVAYYLISPLWRNTTLDEALPGAEESSTAASEEPQGMNPVINDNLDAMDEETKKQFMSAVEDMKDKVMTTNETMPVSAPQTGASAPAGPTVLGEAELKPRSHEVEGKALLVQTGGKTFLRFEDLDTINGPDLRIYLSAGLNVDDAMDLGPIRATQGNVNYELPAGTDTTKYRNALIWCRAFGVLFSYAQL